MKNHSYIILLILISNLSYSQKDRSSMTKEDAYVIINASLKDTTLHNIIGEKPMLTNESKAIEYAESVLFAIYERENIENQKPYNVFYINNYWLISGTLPEAKSGGTFLIIIDSRNYQVIRITHGK